jgi:hypothetical protein
MSLLASIHVLSGRLRGRGCGALGGLHELVPVVAPPVSVPSSLWSRIKRSPSPSSSSTRSGRVPLLTSSQAGSATTQPSASIAKQPLEMALHDWLAARQILVEETCARLDRQSADALAELEMTFGLFRPLHLQWLDASRAILVLGNGLLCHATFKANGELGSLSLDKTLASEQIDAARGQTHFSDFILCGDRAFLACRDSPVVYQLEFDFTKTPRAVNHMKIHPLVTQYTPPKNSPRISVNEPQSLMALWWSTPVAPVSAGAPVCANDSREFE